MRIIELAFNDLKQILRDKKSFLFLLLMPVVFTAFMGYAFGPGDDGESLPRLGWADPEPEGLISKALIDQITISGDFSVEMIGPELVEQAEDRVKNGDLAGLVIVPPAFNDALLSGDEAVFTVVADESGLDGQAVRQAVQTAWGRVQSALEIARLSDTVAVPSDGAAVDSGAAVQTAFVQSLRRWETPAVAVVSQPAVAKEAVLSPSGFNQSSPGMMVQFAIFGLITSAGVLVHERRSGTLGRLMTTSLPRVAVIAGHLLALFLIAFVQGLILMVFGQAAFGVNYLAEPLGALIVLGSLALWTGCLGLLIGLLANVEEQVVIFGMIAMFVVSAFGGVWFPLEVAGSAFSTIGHLTPGAWAMDGFQNILLRGLGLESVLLPVAISLGYALLFFGLAYWRFRRTETG